MVGDEADYWIIHEPFATSAYCLYRADRYETVNRELAVYIFSLRYVFLYTYIRALDTTRLIENSHVCVDKENFVFVSFHVIVVALDLPRQSKKYISYAYTCTHGWPIIIIINGRLGQTWWVARETVKLTSNKQTTVIYYVFTQYIKACGWCRRRPRVHMVCSVSS